MYTIIGCEESQTVLKAFLRKGHKVYSCDTEPASGGIDHLHIKADLLTVLGGIYICPICSRYCKQDHNSFSCETCMRLYPLNFNNGECFIKWKRAICHPPCTRLTVTANKWYKPEFRHRFPNILEEREEAVLFFMKIANADIDEVGIENPVGIMSTRWRKPDQYIQPWQFGDEAVKKTGLWLKNLPKLVSTKIVEPKFVEYNSIGSKSGKSKYPLMWSGKHTAQQRSKTFKGIAEAMAEQWGGMAL